MNKTKKSKNVGKAMENFHRLHIANSKTTTTKDHNGVHPSELGIETFSLTTHRHKHRKM